MLGSSDENAYYQRRCTSLGLGTLHFSLIQSRLLFLLLISGSFSSLRSLVRQTDLFLALQALEICELFSYLLLGRRLLSSQPKLYLLGTLMVCSSLFSLFSMIQQLDSLNFSLGYIYMRFRIRLWCSNPSADGRSLGLVVKHSLSKLQSYSEQKDGMRSNTPALIFFFRLWMSWAAKGGLNAASSYNTQPNDQMSHLPLQGRSDQTQGLAQQGVPVCVTASPLLLILLTFMSASRVSSQFLVSSMFALLISLWKMFMRCRVLSACSTWMPILQIQLSGTISLRFMCERMKEVRSPPSANSVMSRSAPEVQSQVTSLKESMQGLVMEARILTSLRVLVIQRWLVLAIFIFFIAQMQPSSFLLTLQTVAKAPQPTLAITSKFCISLIKNKFLFPLQPHTQSNTQPTQSHHKILFNHHNYNRISRTLNTIRTSQILLSILSSNFSNSDNLLLLFVLANQRQFTTTD